MKYDELTDAAKRNAERNIHNQIKDSPEYETFLRALFATLSNRYEYDETGAIIKVKGE